MAADATCEAVKDRLRPILTLARAQGVFVNFDMEQHDFCPTTQRIFEEIFSEPAFLDWPDVGIVAQAYLRRSLADLHHLRDWAERRGTPVWVRLVKGAYWDYETIIAAQRGHPVPVYQHKAETDANFEACAAFLVENWQTLRPAIASHNVRSAARTQALAQAHGLPPRAVEYQVLFGMGEPIGRALARAGRACPGVCAVWRVASGHGLSGAPPAGEHVPTIRLCAVPGKSAMRTSSLPPPPRPRRLRSKLDRARLRRPRPASAMNPKLTLPCLTRKRRCRRPWQACANVWAKPCRL